jgi:hypothetical protein
MVNSIGFDIIYVLIHFILKKLSKIFKKTNFGLYKKPQKPRVIFEPSDSGYLLLYPKGYQQKKEVENFTIDFFLLTVDLDMAKSS